MEQIISEILEWDSCFFGYRVGRIISGDEAESKIIAELNRLRMQGCRLVYVFSPQSLVLDGFDSFLADRKRSYILTNPEYKPLDIPVIPVHKATEDLYELACQAGEFSRYRVDHNIMEDDARRLYRLWLDNSLSHQFADYVLCCESNGIQTGLVTAKVKGPDLSIGLIATDSRHRGQGIGSAMIQTIINMAHKKGLQVEVTTQADNLLACRFYQHHGFRLQQEDFVYHVWF